MRARTLIWIGVTLFAPLTVSASTFRMGSYATYPSLFPIAPYGTSATAFKTGDVFSIIVAADGNSQSLVTAELAPLGLSATSTGLLGGPSYAKVGGVYSSNAYMYRFDGLSVPAVSDGVKDISIAAADPSGNIGSTTLSIAIDNTLPTVSITSISFSTTSPKDGDYMLLSGKVDGTGSIGTVSQVQLSLINADGTPDRSSIAGGSIAMYDPKSINDALSTSTDGSFTNAAIRLVEFGDTGWISRAATARIDLTVYDGAGHTATTSLSVSIPKTPPPDPCIAAGTCVSNVMFLPGIEGSRLYEGTGCGKSAEEKLWEPADSLLNVYKGDGHVGRLALDATGKSACTDIYAKEGDIVDSIYSALEAQMDGLKSEGTIKDWKPVAYDWRLSLDDLMERGTVHGSNIYYEEASSSPYLLQTVRALAASSKTGKVTIIAHSNGGLVAKKLLSYLGDSAASSLVDRVILVAVPQSGAPADIGSLLVGYSAGIYSYGLPIVSDTAARTFAQNSPMAYHLLPSEDYLESTVADSAHPVVRFSGSGWSKEKTAYGTTIANRAALDDFLLAKEGGRKQANDSDLMSPKIVNESLVGYANAAHAALDRWTPPSGIEVDEIAGWGIDTVAGIDFYTQAATDAASASEPTRMYRPIIIEDGDGTVPVPSALQMASSTNVKRYWLDMDKYNRDKNLKNKHADVFKLDPILAFLREKLYGNDSLSSQYLYAQPIMPINTNKRLIFFLHSPLTLELADSSGNITGIAHDGSVSQDIPGSTYSEFGEVKYVTVPEGNAYTVTMHGQASGTFSLDVQDSSGSVSTIAGVPTTDSTLSTLSITGGIRTLSALSVDENGDGSEEFNIEPKTGETVLYTPLEPPAPPSQMSVVTVAPQSFGGAISPIATTAPLVPNVVPSMAASSGTPSTSTSTVGAPIVIANHGTAYAKRITIKSSSTTSAQKKAQISQTASVLTASQQLEAQSWGNELYNRLYTFWKAITHFF